MVIELKKLTGVVRGFEEEVPAEEELEPLEEVESDDDFEFGEDES